MSVLQYLSGYVSHKVFVTLRKGTKYHKVPGIRWCCDVLKAAKVEDRTEKEYSSMHWTGEACGR